MGYDYADYREMSYNIGRFLSPDPVEGDPENPQSLNRYAYVLNNPTNFTDPLGLTDCPQGKTCGPPNLGGDSFFFQIDPSGWDFGRSLLSGWNEFDLLQLALNSIIPPRIITTGIASDYNPTIEHYTTILPGVDIDFGSIFSLAYAGGWYSNLDRLKLSRLPNQPQQQANNPKNQSTATNSLEQRVSHFVCKDSPEKRIFASMRFGFATGALRGGIYRCYRWSFL